VGWIRSFLQLLNHSFLIVIGNSGKMLISVLDIINVCNLGGKIGKVVILVPIISNLNSDSGKRFFLKALMGVSLIQRVSNPVYKSGNVLILVESATICFIVTGNFGKLVICVWGTMIETSEFGIGGNLRKLPVYVQTSSSN